MLTFTSDRRLATSKFEAHSDRCATFQRMLDLEKQYMLARLQVATRSQPARATTPYKAEHSSNMSSRRPGIHSSNDPSIRIGTDSTVDLPTSPKKPQSSSSDQQFLHTDSSLTTLGQDFGKAELQHDASQKFESEGKAESNVAAFDRPAGDPDQRSICVSPSWEAHERRKKEKKLKIKMGKEGKNEKEKIVRSPDARRKQNRLSKLQTPASSTKTFGTIKHLNTEQTAPSLRGRRNERYSSEPKIRSPTQDDAGSRKRRSRSSSFASLIRSPFEFRRSSVGQTFAPEFIGGVKLDFERHLAYERSLSEQGLVIDSSVHPALRNKCMTDRRWSAQLSGTFSRPPASATSMAEHTRGRYPPIVRMGRTSVAPPPLTTTAPSVPALSNIEKCRIGNDVGASLGLQSYNAENAVSAISLAKEATVQFRARPMDLTLPDVLIAGEAMKAKSPNSDLKQKGIASPSKWTASQSPTLQHPEAMSMTVQSSVAPTEATTESDVDLDCKAQDASCGYSAALSRRMSPAPPRRSSKRSSQLDRPTNICPIATPKELRRPAEISTPSDLAVSDVYSMLINNSKSESQRLLSEESSPGRATTDKSIEGFDISGNTLNPQLPKHFREAASTQGASSSNTSCLSNAKHRLISSSDDSCSDEPHAFSPLSTPPSSRPQSAKEDISSKKDGKPLPQIQALQNILPDSPKSAYHTYPVSDGQETTIQATAGSVLSSSCKIAVDCVPTGRMESRRSLDRSDALSFHNARRQASGKSSETLGVDEFNHPILPDDMSRTLQTPRRLRVQPRSNKDLEAGQRQVSTASCTQGLEQYTGAPRPSLAPDKTSTQSVEFSSTSRVDSHHASCLPLIEGTRYERQPIAKVFVECCGCKFFHDMPSHLYEAMAHPSRILSGKDAAKYSDSISMTVKCPWCRHEMSTKCCAGLAAMVHIQEQLH